MAASETGVIGAMVLETGAHHASAQYRLSKLSALFDESNEWKQDRSPTAAHWIAERLDVEVCTAREWIRVGRKLTALPALDAAFHERDLSYSKVRALSRFATPDNETELIELARSVPAGKINPALAAWSIQNETADVIEERQQRDRGIFASLDADGMIVGRFRLPPLEGAEVLAALDGIASKRLDASAGASLAQRRVDALSHLVKSGNTGINSEVVLHVRGDGSSFDDGTPISDSIVEQIIPKSFIRMLIHDAERRPLNASSRQRHPTLRQKRVVKERDRCCVDCGSTEFLQYDHVPDWTVSRRTVVDELQLRCSTCNDRRHNEAA
jgi:hypothetical protein